MTVAEPDFTRAIRTSDQRMRVYGVADQIRDRIGLKPWPMIRAFVDSLAVTAESTRENQMALAAGRQLSLEAAIYLANDIFTNILVTSPWGGKGSPPRDSAN